MASMETEPPPQVEEQEGEQEGGAPRNMELNNNNNNRGSNKKKKKRIKRSSYLPKFGCFRIQHDDATGKSFDMEVVDGSGHRPNPSHLIIMVNGLIGSPKNWKFAAKQFLKRYPDDVIVHCSECNSSMLTFDGVDIMGERLAEEVISVIKRHPSVQKISFVGHSLGGVVARYTIAKLYGRDISQKSFQENGHHGNQNLDQACNDRKYEGTIAGLEPINFITSATPHLGSRGHKQVPAFCGFYSLEKTASRVSRLLGRTGKHLFLTDHDNGKPPLLLQMVRDSEDLKFISALQSFKRRVAYANRRHLSRLENYPHIVNVETEKSTSVPEEVPTDTRANSGSRKLDLEEEMIRGLTTVSWERIDVNFNGSRQKYLAHTTIQVESYRINSDGRDVIQHMIDNFQL